MGAGSWQAVAVYMIVLTVISFGSVLGLKELTKADTSDTKFFTVSEVEALPVLD